MVSRQAIICLINGNVTLEITLQRECLWLNNEATRYGGALAILVKKMTLLLEFALCRALHIMRLSILELNLR